MNNNYLRENNSRQRYSPYGPQANSQSQQNDNEDEVLSAKSGPGQLAGLPVLTNLSQQYNQLDNPLSGAEVNNLSGHNNMSNQFYGGGRGVPPDFTSFQGRRESPDNMLENARGALDGDRYGNNNFFEKDYK